MLFVFPLFFLSSVFCSGRYSEEVIEMEKDHSQSWNRASRGNAWSAAALYH